jgi:hypothetical protein
MMGWEEPLSASRSLLLHPQLLIPIVKEHVRLMTSSHPDAQQGSRGISVLNVGYGLGIVCPRPRCAAEAEVAGRPSPPIHIAPSFASHHHRGPPPGA